MEKWDTFNRNSAEQKLTWPHNKPMKVKNTRKGNEQGDQGSTLNPRNLPSRASCLHQPLAPGAGGFLWTLGWAGALCFPDISVLTRWLQGAGGQGEDGSRGVCVWARTPKATWRDSSLSPTASSFLLTGSDRVAGGPSSFPWLQVWNPM